MEQETLISIIGVGSALAGTAVGSISAYFANKSMKNIEWNHSVKRQKIEEKTKLYTAFLREATNLAMDSRDSKVDGVSGLKELTALAIQIELTAPESVHSKAFQVADGIVYSHVREDQKRKDDDAVPYPEARRQFISAVKAELSALENITSNSMRQQNWLGRLTASRRAAP